MFLRKEKKTRERERESAADVNLTKEQESSRANVMSGKREKGFDGSL